MFDLKQFDRRGGIRSCDFHQPPASCDASQAPWATGPYCTRFRTFAGWSLTAAKWQAAHLASLDACRSPQVLHLAGRRLRGHQDARSLL